MKFLDYRVSVTRDSDTGQLVAQIPSLGIADYGKDSRQKGGHARYIKANRGVTVPIHPGDVPATVIRSILKQAGLSENEWDAL